MKRPLTPEASAAILVLLFLVTFGTLLALAPIASKYGASGRPSHSESAE